MYLMKNTMLKQKKMSSLIPEHENVKGTFQINCTFHLLIQM